MSSLERAKQFLAAKVAKLAIAAIPLALVAIAAAPHANAGTFRIDTNAASGGCAVLQGLGFCSASSTPVGGDPSFNWISASGNVSSSNGSLEINVGGGIVSGGFAVGDVIPVSWDFFVNSEGVEGTITPTLSYFLTGEGNPFTATLDTTTYGNQTHYTGSGQITVASTVVEGDAWGIDLQVAGDSGAFTVDIPAGQTLDYNTAVTAAPEPASLALAGVGLLSALVLKRRRKA
jgi:hypothetical protein